MGVVAGGLNLSRTHLSDNLIGALDEDLHGPPVVVGHPIQKPLKETQQRDVEFGTQAGNRRRKQTAVQRRSSDLAGRLAVVELFGEQLDPLQHGGLMWGDEGTR